MTIVFPHHQDSLAGLAARLRRLANDLDRLVADGRPSAADMAGAPVLSRVRMDANQNPGLRGVVSGHPDLPEGEWVDTTDLYAVDYHGAWARTWDGWFSLGPKSPPLRGRPR